MNLQFLWKWNVTDQYGRTRVIGGLRLHLFKIHLTQRNENQNSKKRAQCDPFYRFFLFYWGFPKLKSCNLELMIVIQFAPKCKFTEISKFWHKSIQLHFLFENLMDGMESGADISQTFKATSKLSTDLYLIKTLIQIRIWSKLEIHCWYFSNHDLKCMGI